MTECPRCMSWQVRRSKSGNATLVFPLNLLLVCLRCHDCGRKFYRFRFAVDESRSPYKAASRKGGMWVATMTWGYCFAAVAKVPLKYAAASWPRASSARRNAGLVQYELVLPVP